MFVTDISTIYHEFLVDKLSANLNKEDEIEIVENAKYFMDDRFD